MAARLILMAGVVLGLFAGPRVSQAQNLLLNGAFDDADEIAGWIGVPTGAATWDMDVDATDAADSGSLRLFRDPDTFGSARAQQCLNMEVMSGETYEFGSSFRMLDQPPNVGFGSLRIVWYVSQDCIGAQVGASEEPGGGVEPAPEFTELRGSDVVPEGASGLLLELRLFKNSIGVGSDFVGHHDDAFVTLPEPAGPVGALASLVALAFARRRVVKAAWREVARSSLHVHSQVPPAERAAW